MSDFRCPWPPLQVKLANLFDPVSPLVSRFAELDTEVKAGNKTVGDLAAEFRRYVPAGRYQGHTLREEAEEALLRTHIGMRFSKAMEDLLFAHEVASKNLAEKSREFEEVKHRLQGEMDERGHKFWNCFNRMCNGIRKHLFDTLRPYCSNDHDCRELVGNLHGIQMLTLENQFANQSQSLPALHSRLSALWDQYSPFFVSEP